MNSGCFFRAALLPSLLSAARADRALDRGRRRGQDAHGDASAVAAAVPGRRADSGIRASSITGVASAPGALLRLLHVPVGVARLFAASGVAVALPSADDAVAVPCTGVAIAVDGARAEIGRA